MSQNEKKTRKAMRQCPSLPGGNSRASLDGYAGILSSCFLHYKLSKISEKDRKIGRGVRPAWVGGGNGGEEVVGRRRRGSSPATG